MNTDWGWREIYNSDCVAVPLIRTYNSEPMRLLLLTVLLLCAGCWPVAYPASAKGTWTGTVVPVTMDTANGQAYPAMVLKIETGPEAKSRTMPKDRPGPHPMVVLLDKAGRLLSPTASAGTKVKVSGEIGPGLRLAPDGDRIESSSIDESISNLFVSGSPKTIGSP